MKKIIEGAKEVLNQGDEYIHTKQEREAIASERHQTDMQSDNWFAKSIRPVVFLLLTTMVCIAILCDLFFNKNMSQGSLNLLQQSFWTMMAFYTTSRGLEKVAAHTLRGSKRVMKQNRRRDRA